MPAPSAIPVAGVRISHPERIVYPELGVTKVDLARFYEAIGHWMLPHVRGRPLTLVRCPTGVAAPCVFMRHSNAWGPQPLRRVLIQEKTKTGEYLYIDDVAGIVSLVQMGILEIHTQNVTARDLARPDRVVFDLDPGDAVPWSEVVLAARELRDRLGDLGLESWVKTTGGKGLHVFVPIAPELGWDPCIAFARAVAAAMEQDDPARFTIRLPKAPRRAKILVDYLRNNRANTSVAAYSTRAKPTAPVSMPLEWSELQKIRRSDMFTIAEAARRIGAQRRDPWAAYFKARQRLTARTLRAVGVT